MVGMYGQNGFNLQATLSAASSMSSAEPLIRPHHPITCQGALRYEEDGTFRCEHVEVPPGDARTGYCIDHSIALLLLEIARKEYG